MLLDDGRYFLGELLQVGVVAARCVALLALERLLVVAVKDLGVFDVRLVTLWQRQLAVRLQRAAEV